MNKNIIKLFAILVMCFMIGSVLVACGSQGEQGEKGEQGAPGATGEAGPQGPAGLTPFIGTNGNWWIGEKDTGVKAKGEDLRDCENHHWDKYFVTVQEHAYDPATDKATIGVVLKACVDCGDSYFFEIDHEFTKVVTAPTCTAKGYTTYTCDCGYTFDADYTDMVPHVWGEWEKVLNTAGICECEWDQPYIRHCTVCGIEDEQTKTTPAPGHTYTTYKPALRDENLNISDCNWVAMEVAQCDVCGHKDCYDMKPAGDGKAPGHKWGEWYVVTAPTADAEGTIARDCSVCASTHPTEGVQTDKVPALNETDYTYVVKTAPACETTGVGVYTYNAIKSIVVEVVLAANGHNFNDSTELTNLVKPTTTTPGSVTVGCVDCDHTVVVEIPVVGGPLTGRFITGLGNCLEPMDTYTMPLAILVDAENGIYQRTFITFEVDGGYEHDDMPAAEELKKVDGEDKWYYVYWCEKCEHWIIADWEPKTNA